MAEIKRIENVSVDYHYDTNCIECGRKLELWWNDGELDYQECCGYIYGLEHTKVDFVIETQED